MKIRLAVCSWLLGRMVRYPPYSGTASAGCAGKHVVPERSSDYIEVRVVFPFCLIKVFSS